jgi:NAD(P)H dehydrogenase (quinone)
MAIVVTAATGRLGRLVIAELLARGVPADGIVAAGRTPELLEDLAERGVRTARIDYSDPDTLDGVFAAGDTVLLISGSEVGRRIEQHGNVVDAAARAGVARLAYTSVLGADGTTLPIAPEHVQTERLVRASGLAWTLLRNGWYTENYGPALEQAAATGEVVSSATRADYAAAAAGALTTDGHTGRTYELSGDTAWTFDDLAAAFSTLLGRPVAHRRVSPDEHRELLAAAGVDAQTAGFLVTMDESIRDGALATTTGDLARLAGRPTTPLLDALRPLR